jgi:hypothetical protein
MVLGSAESGRAVFSWCVSQPFAGPAAILPRGEETRKQNKYSVQYIKPDLVLSA